MLKWLISFIYIRKSNGSKIRPCGTSDIISCKSDFTSSFVTSWKRSYVYEIISLMLPMRSGAVKVCEWERQYQLNQRPSSNLRIRRRHTSLYQTNDETWNLSYCINLRSSYLSFNCLNQNHPTTTASLKENPYILSSTTFTNCALFWHTCIRLSFCLLKK